MPSLTTRPTPRPGRSRTQKIKERLFAYPGAIAPDSLKTLYIIACKYILRDFYGVEFESYEYHYVPVLEATLVRFTTLVRGLASPGPAHIHIHASCVRRQPCAEGVAAAAARWETAPARPALRERGVIGLRQFFPCACRYGARALTLDTGERGPVPAACHTRPLPLASSL